MGEYQKTRGLCSLDKRHSFLQRFLTRYVLQASVHVLWKERNDRRQVAALTSVKSLAKCLEKLVRNRCLLLSNERFQERSWFKLVDNFLENLVALG